MMENAREGDVAVSTFRPATVRDVSLLKEHLRTAPSHGYYTVLDSYALMTSASLPRHCSACDETSERRN